MGKTNIDILKAATTSADLVAGGLMTPQQAKVFLRMVFDTTALLQICRTINMPSPAYEIDKIGVGQRLMRGMGENEDMYPYTKKPTFGKINLVAKKYALPWELSEDALEDNIEGKTLEQVIAEMFASQMGMDTEDIAVNGDTVYPTTAPATTISGTITAVVTTIPLTAVTGFPRNSDAGYVIIESEAISYTGISALNLIGCTRGANGTTAAAHTSGAAATFQRHPLIGNDDGWLKLMRSGSSHYINLAPLGATAGKIDKAHFFALYRALPQKYTRGAGRAGLRWMISSYQKSLWEEYITSRLTGAGDAVLGGADLKPLGIPMVEVPSFPQDMVLLTYPKNLIVGIWRNIKVRKTDQDKESIMKDLIFYNTTTRMDFQVEETDAVAFGDGLLLS